MMQNIKLKMAPSSGCSILLITIFRLFFFTDWVTAKLSCVIGNLDQRLLMKEYDCRDFAYKAEIEKHRKEHFNLSSLGHYTTIGNKSLSPEGVHVKYITYPNISVAVLPKVMATSCYIFKYEVVQEVMDNNRLFTEVSLHANFSCDFKNICQGQRTNSTRQVKLGGYKGELHCCDADNCNTADTMRNLPPHQQLCYNASSNGDSKTAVVDFCRQPDTWCARATRIDTGKEEEMYFCDNEHHCQNFSLTTDNPSQEMCKTVTIGVQKIELCCCAKNKCYTPKWLQNNQVKDNKPVPSGKSPGLSWLFVGGLILMALASAAILSMVWMGIRHCRKKARENTMTLTYTRLNVSLPEPGREDTQVLLE